MDATQPSVNSNRMNFLAGPDLRLFSGIRGKARPQFHRDSPNNLCPNPPMKSQRITIAVIAAALLLSLTATGFAAPEIVQLDDVVYGRVHGAGLLTD